MAEGKHTLEELFSIREQKKLGPGCCKTVCSLEARERVFLQAQITDRLHHLLHQDPTHAFLVCQRCEECPVLRRVLRGPCWGVLLRACCQHLGARQEGQPWPSPHFPRAVRVLYTLLKEQPSQDHHQDYQKKSQQGNQQWTQQESCQQHCQQESCQQHCQQESCQQHCQQKYQQEHNKDHQNQPLALRALLEAARVALTLALLDGGPLASGSHALVTSTALCLLLQYLEPRRATVAFLNTLWTINHLAGKKKAAINMVCGDTKDREVESVDDNDDVEMRGAKDYYRTQKDTEKGIIDDRITNTTKGHVQEKHGVGGENTDTNSNKENTREREKVKEQEKYTLTDRNNRHTIKTTWRNTSATQSLMLEDVHAAIDTARREDEGRKLMRRNFEGMEESYASSTLLLQGMLNAGEKWLLQEDNEERYGGRAFLYSLHPLFLKLCSGGAAQYTFQAFQTLLLWIRAVRELGTRERAPSGRTKSKVREGGNCKVEEGVLDGLTTTTTTTSTSRQAVSHPSKDALFSMTPGSQGPVFTLLNASWESPAKGMGEAVMRCVEELLSLHEDGTEGARQQLATDMLQALLSSSSSSSSSSSVTSVWTSKSTYPPLALAVTHLGCEEALHLYPSLPVSLVSSLGVNHLAPASTSVYKVFLAQLGEASWSQHFLAPISEVLCSQDRLTQQYLLALWLPPTLKKYPGIHWVLLASCSTSTPGWLARMALLKTARLVGTLDLGDERKSARVKEGPLPRSQHERMAAITLMSGGETCESAESDAFKLTKSARDEDSEAGAKHVSEKASIKAACNTKDNSEREREEALILPYIHAALRHRDENVRLEALSVLCHTQKTSQPVSPFEAVSLKSFLRWNMNIDFAPFRQGVLKCVAVLLVRLKGAAASYCKGQSAKGGRFVENGPVELAGSPRSFSVAGLRRRDTGDPEGKQEKILSPESNVQKPTDLRGKQLKHSDKKLERTAEKPTSPHYINQECGVLEVHPNSVLSTSADLVLWLVKEAHRGMAPDANYQRRILALQLYREVLMALLPSSLALPHRGKRVTASSDTLLLYLNTVAASYKKNTDIDAVSHLPVKPPHQSTFDDKITTGQSPNYMISEATINSKSDRNKSPSRLPFQGFNCDSSTDTTNLPPCKLFSNTDWQKDTLQTSIDTQARERSQSHHHSGSPLLDVYGDERALGQPLVDLAFPWTLNTLLYLCMDEMNDVRAEAREILHIFTSQGKMVLSPSEGREWMNRALKLCDSPKASDAESGGTLTLTVALLIPEEHMSEVLQGMPGMGSESDGGGESYGTNTSSSPPCLAEYLLARVECQFTAAKTSLLRAARHTPIHGTLQALGSYFTQKKEEEVKKITEKEKKVGKKEAVEKVATPSLLPSFLPRLASLLQRLVEFVLDTLASTSSLGPALPPSFAEMGEAVKKVVEEGKEEVKEEEEEKDKNMAPPSDASLLEQEDEVEEGFLSSDHVLVLSCCWQILKGCCEVTSQVIHLFANDPQAADDLIRAVVVRVLLGTRHKGAMEAARATYGSLWACLLQRATVGGPFGTPDPCFVDILHQQVGEVVWLLGAPRGTSVTRRAAGVAMMVQAACGAAPRLTPTLLSTTVTALTTIARSEVRADESGTTDAPQALALHVLQSLALLSPLGPFLRPQLTPLTSTCLHAFASPSWAIRNAALQLFGSLVSSLVGQKKVKDDTSALNSLTTPEFLSRHPSLVHLLLAALDGDLGCHIGQERFHHSASSAVVSNKLGHSDNSAVPPNTLTQDVVKLADTETHTPEYTHTHVQALHKPTDILRHSETHTFPRTEAYSTHAPLKDMHTDTHTLEHAQTYSGAHKTLKPPQDTYTSTHTIKYTPIDSCTHTPRACNTGTQKQTNTPTHKQTDIKSASILVPVLSLVARLSPGTGLQQNPHLTEMLHTLWHSTARLLESPVYNVRRLAALALVSLTPSNEALPQTMKILLKASDPMTPTNLLHGHLLALSSFLQTHPRLAENAKLRKSASVSLLWLLSPKNRCHVNTALALKIMMALSINIVDACHIPALGSSLPGAAECRRILTLMRLSQWPRSTFEDLFLSELPVGSDNLESCSDAFLSKIRDCHCASWLLKYECFFWQRLEDGSLMPKGVAALLYFLTAIMEEEESAGASVPKHSLATLISYMEGSQGSRATCAGLVLMAHLMRHPTSITEGILVAFARAVTRHSHPTASEDYRLAASAALKVALKPILTCHPSVTLPVKEQLIVSTVALLQDEDSSIRDAATGIVVALVTPSGEPLDHSPHPQPTPHPNLAVFDFLQWLANKSIEGKDWTTLRILWELCFGQAGPKSSLPATARTASHLRLFQSHSANLYYESRQVSIMVGVALMGAIEGDNRRAFAWEGHQQNPSQHKLQPGKEYNLEQNCKNGQENCKTGNKGSSNHPQTSPRDWLEAERAKINSRGEALSSLASRHNLWPHRPLAFEAGVYVVSCKVFQLLCWAFGVSPELVYPLVWGEEGYCTVEMGSETKGVKA